MDYDYAVDRHRQPLLDIVAALCALIGLASGGTVERVAWPIYRKALAVLRPAESAVRRLIVVAAQGLTVEARVGRPVQTKRGKRAKRKAGLVFQLFDRCVPLNAGRARIVLAPRAEPRIRSFDFDPRIPQFLRSAPPAPAPKPRREETASAGTLCRRLAAIQQALQDLPRQARRYARWQAKSLADRNPRRDTILRRGPPPGLRRTSRHAVHAILSECHGLARSLPGVDSS